MDTGHGRWRCRIFVCLLLLRIDKRKGKRQHRQPSLRFSSVIHSIHQLLFMVELFRKRAFPIHNVAISHGAFLCGTTLLLYVRHEEDGSHIPCWPSSY